MASRLRLSTNNLQINAMAEDQNGGLHVRGSNYVENLMLFEQVSLYMKGL